MYAPNPLPSRMSCRGPTGVFGTGSPACCSRSSPSSRRCRERRPVANFMSLSLSVRAGSLSAEQRNTRFFRARDGYPVAGQQTLRDNAVGRTAPWPGGAHSSSRGRCGANRGYGHSDFPDTRGLIRSGIAQREVLVFARGRRDAAPGPGRDTAAGHRRWLRSAPFADR